MKKVSIEIEQLGIIKSTSIDFNDVMIFSGDSSTGKSYTAFLFYYLNSVLFRGEALKNFFKEVNVISNTEQLEFDFSLESFNKWLDTSSVNYLGYLVGNKEIIAKVHFNLDLDFSHFNILIEETKDEDNGNSLFRVLYVNNKKVISYQLGPSIPIDLVLSVALQRYFVNLYFNSAEAVTSPTLLLLPPSRGGFMGLNYKGKTEFLSNAGMYKEFTQQLDDLDSPRFKESKIPSFYEEYTAKLLDGEIIKDNDKLHLVMNDGHTIPLTAAASSIKELSPLFLALQKRPVDSLLMLFEEPEAHLHPQLQMLVAELLIVMINNGAKVQITTHSDFFLARFADAIRMYEVKELIADNDEFCKFCDTILWNKDVVLNPKVVNALSYKKDRENGNVIVRKQDMLKYELFSSFDTVVDSRINTSTEIRNKLEDLLEDGD